MSAKVLSAAEVKRNMERSMKYLGRLDVDADIFFDKSGFIAPKLADYIKDMCVFKTMKDTKQIYVYTAEGIYKPEGEVLIAEIVREILGEEAKKNRVSEVMAHIQDTTYTDRTQFDTDKKYLCVENGLLNMDTLEFYKHDPSIMKLTKIPITFQLDTKCPNIMRFLSEIVYGRDIPLLQEFVGYCLYPEHFIRVMIILHGGGANGKTTFITLLTNFLGIENISSVSIQEFAKDRFAKAQLFGKMANLCDDLPAKTVYSTGTLKQLTGSSPISAQFKFQNSFRFVSYAKMLFSANELPTVKDKTPAFWQRLKMITFPFEFVDNPSGEQKQKKDMKLLLEQMSTPDEMSGLLNWAIEGLKRLRETGHFSYSKSAEDVRDEYERKSNPVNAFIQACMLQKSELETPKNRVYARYVTYCKSEGYPIKSDNAFARALREELGENIDDKQARTGDKRQRVWIGIGFLDEKDKKQSKLHEKYPDVIK